MNEQAMIHRAPAGEIRARRLILRGQAQGLGVRPAIYRLAQKLQLAGTVENTRQGVQICLEGRPQQLELFDQLLPSNLPTGTELKQIDAEPIPTANRSDFRILRQDSAMGLAAPIPPDRAVCPECLAEVDNRDNRRAGYPLTSCTACGPRFSIVRAMPYERPDTTMAEFPLCPDCTREYDSPGDRRFHAQTNACPACGPAVWCVEKPGQESTRGDDAIRIAADSILQGKIVALKGLGGYQLLADATNVVAVNRLRERKGRPAKPLAVLVQSLEAARQLAQLNETEAEAITSPANPIVLVAARSDSPLANGVHPGLDTVGLLLPTTPLHALILKHTGRPLVCTSGNREGEPLAWRTKQAEEELADICDLWLHHNREIAQPIDDSVVRVIAGRATTIRLARGLAPLVLDLPRQPSTLALGGHMKSAVAFSNGEQAVLAPHVGELQGHSTRQRYIEQLSDWQQLYRFKNPQLVHDTHPEYFSTQWADQQTAERLAVAHHHAHIVAGMLEKGWLDRTVLGVAFDGSGHGDDGTIWGGEFLIASTGNYRRMARLRPFALPGGEAAILQPWRIAVSLLQDAMDEGAIQAAKRLDILPDRVYQVAQLATQTEFSPTTSSAGRLFDAAAALVLGVTESGYEGQGPAMLEAAADRTAVGRYRFPLVTGSLAQLDWRPLICDVIDDLRRGTSTGTIAMRFHRTIAEGIAAVCQIHSDLPVVLSGGVFQNRLLTELVVEQLPDRPLGLCHRIPPNDGGLAAGQLAIACARQQRND